MTSSLLERLLDVLPDNDPVPNRFTIRMGELVRQARHNQGYSQRRLADLVYRRRATISDIENGKSEVTVTTLAYIAAALDKPLCYFLPWFVYDNLKHTELNPAQAELLIQFDRITHQQLQQLALKQAKQVADLDIKLSREEISNIRAAIDED